MKRILLLLIFFCAIISAAQAEPLDLIDFARLTATGTQPTFLLLWPRETDDAPYTIRDGDPVTGWKTPRRGVHTLTIDFAPLLAHPPVVMSVAAEWGTKPAGPVSVRVLDYCGGTVLDEQPWPDVSAELSFAVPAEAFCIEVAVQDAGPANLIEMHVYAAPVWDEPAIDQVEVQQTVSGLRLNWSANAVVHHVDIHYVVSEDDELNRWTLIDSAPAGEPWIGPLPAYESALAVLIPVADDGSVGPKQIIEIPSRGVPTLSTSGVVEGFYGRPWSHSERRAMLSFLGRIGLGLYIYGPKNDPLHRDEWRIPYDDEAVAKFTELLHLGRAVGVTFSFGISPGKDMVMDDPDERATLMAKLAPFLEGGFRHFTLLLDDIEGDISVPINGALARQHVELANWLRNELTSMAGDEVALWVVPTVYSTQRQNDWPGGSEYLDVCADLDLDIVVMWTGTDTFSPTLSAADLADVTARIGRQPAIWDNEHGTDGGDGFVGKVYLAPYLNRSADLVAAVEGIVTNPMILGAANRLMLGTYAAYLRDPGGYDPDGAQAPAARLVSSSETDRQLAVYLVETFYGNGALGFDGLNFPNNLAMNDAIDRLSDLLPDGSREEFVAAGERLLHVAAQMATTQTLMHHSGLDVSLIDDLWFPADRLTGEGHALLFLLDYLGSVLAGAPDESALDRADQLLWNAMWHNRYELSLLRPNVFRSRLGNHPPGALGFTMPVIDKPLEQTLRAGEEWRYSAAPDAEVSVYGLAGATIIDRVVHWTPRHSGQYQMIVLATNSDGWNWEELTLTVAPAPEQPDDDNSDDDSADDDAGDDDTSSTNRDDDNEVGCGC